MRFGRTLSAIIARMLRRVLPVFSPARPRAPVLVLAIAAACADASAPPGADAGASADAAATAADASLVSDAADAGDEPLYFFWQDVEPIVAAKCQQCHGATPMFGARVPLVEYADTQVALAGDPTTRMHEAMAFRVVAPQSRMPPPSQPQLTADEIRVLQAWSRQGAPEGTRPVRDDAGVVEPRDAGASTPDSGVGRTWTWELRAHAPNDLAAPYPLPQEGTNYQCWGFTVPADMPMNQAIVRFEHLIDNARHIHHTLLFKDRSGNAGDGPFGCGLERNWDMVAGWAPGRMAEDMPPGVGVTAKPGERFVLQAHYDKVEAAGETDASGVRVVMTEATALVEAGNMWHGPYWVNPVSGANATRQSECQLRETAVIFSVFPHMHKLGTRITLELQRGGSSTWETIAEVPAWSFEDQPNVAIAPQHQLLGPQDKLRTTCWWNTLGRSVSWGEASDDEMCFNFIYHYPLLPNSSTRCVGLAF
jgi:hypothetical protein